ncbi:MAG: SpaA isopeptide-forming pilin-related protein [Firmicutes bacterium]|nr:SpaA isopeptide-forming pilin-related protein [Bacillota bacterium]
MAMTNALPKGKKRRIKLLALLLLLLLVAIMRLPALHDTFGLSDTKIDLRLDGPVEPLSQFALHISQGVGGDARTTLTLAPGLMFAGSLPANMTEVHYDDATQTLSFAWAPGVPRQAAIQLLTATTASRTVSAVSGNLSGSVTITPAGNSLAAPAGAPAAPAEVAAGSSVTQTPATVPGDTYGPAGSGPAGNNPAAPANPAELAAPSAAPTEAPEPGLTPEPNTVLRDTYGALNTSNVAAASDGGQSGTTAVAPAASRPQAAAPAPAGAGNGQIQVQVYPLSQSVAPGDELYFVAIMNATGMNSDYTNASWDITLNYDPAYVSYVGATSFSDLTGPTVSGDAGSITVAYKFPANDAYAGGIYMSVLDLTTVDTTPEGALVRITAAFDSDQYIVTDDAAQVITAAANQLMGFMEIMPLADSLYTSNLAHILTGVTVTDLYDQPVAEFVIDQNYKFTLSFKENTAYQLQYDNNGVLYYQLPPEIKVLEPVNNEDILVGMQKIGSYSVDTSGYVTVKFDDIMEDPAHPGTWIDTSGTKTNFIDNYVNAFFHLNIKAQFAQAGDNVVIDFGNNYTWTYQILEQPVEAALSIAKDVSYSQDYKLTYTSVITGAQGTVTDLTFRDDAAGYFNLADKSFLEKVEVNIKNQGWVTYDRSLLDAPDVAGTYYWVSAAPNGGFYLCFPGDVTLPAGETIAIRYTVDVPKLQLARNGDPYSYTIYASSLTNHAYASGKDGAGEPLDEVMAEASLTATRSYYKKDGALVGNTLSWTATVGDGKEPVNGKTIFDELQGGLLFNNAPVTIQLFAADNATRIGSDYTPATVPGARFEFTVPATNPPAYYARVSYTLNIANPDNISNYVNRIGVRANNKDYWISSTVYGASTKLPPIYKKGNVTADGKYIQWTVEWTILPTYFGKSVYLSDWFNYGATGYPNVPTDFHVAVNYNTAGGPVTIADLPANDPDLGWWLTTNANQTNWYFYFLPGGKETNGTLNYIPHGANFAPNGIYFDPKPGDSASPFKNGAVVTITYKSSLDDLSKDGVPLRTVLATADPTGNGRVSNYVTSYGYISSWNSAADYVYVCAPIYKSAVSGSDYIDYSIRLNSPGGFYGRPRYESLDLGSDPVFTDTFSSDLEYVDNTFFIWTWNTSNPSSRYFALYSISKEDLLKNCIVTDETTGTSTLTVHLNQLMQITGPNANYNNYNKTPAPWTGPVGNVTTPLPEWWRMENRDNGGYDHPIMIYYRLKLKDDAKPGVHEVYNQATINENWSADNTSTVGKEVVTKVMVLNTAVGNKMAVTVNVNPLGKTLAPDSPDGTYVIEDQMNDTLALFLSSIKIEAETSPGSGVWVEQPIDPTWGNLWSIMTTADNKIFFTAPDRTSIRITYQVLVKGAVGDRVDVENTVSILGEYFTAAHASFLLQKAGATGGGALAPVTLYKQDADQPGVYLPGAIFELYMNQYYTDMPSVTPTGRPNTQANPPETIDGVGFYYAGTWITDINGQVLIQTQYLTADTGAIYALKETVAPAGYRLPDHPFTCFTLGTALLPDGFTQPLQDITDYINITNHFDGGPMLPESGGNGIGRYMVTGMLLLTAAGFLLVRWSARRKTGPVSGLGQ